MAKSKKTAAQEATKPAAVKSTGQYDITEAKLVRKYKGRELIVKVVGGGESFLYGGKSWPSLSALAKHITGRPEVDGPRWFQLRDVPKRKAATKPARKAAAAAKPAAKK